MQRHGTKAPLTATTYSRCRTGPGSGHVQVGHLDRLAVRIHTALRPREARRLRHGPCRTESVAAEQRDGVCRDAGQDGAAVGQLGLEEQPEQEAVQACRGTAERGSAVTARRQLLGNGWLVGCAPSHRCPRNLQPKAAETASSGRGSSVPCASFSPSFTASSTASTRYATCGHTPVESQPTPPALGLACLRSGSAG